MRPHSRPLRRLAVIGLHRPVRTRHVLLENGTLQLRWGDMVNDVSWGEVPLAAALRPAGYSVEDVEVVPAPGAILLPSSPYVHRFVLGLVSVAVVFGAVAASMAVLMLVHRNPLSFSGDCGRCGYNLTGNTSGVCPECGSSVQPAIAESQSSDPSKAES